MQTLKSSHAGLSMVLEKYHNGNGTPIYIENTPIKAPASARTCASKPFLTTNQLRTMELKMPRSFEQRVEINKVDIFTVYSYSISHGYVIIYSIRKYTLGYFTT